uniref:B12-binding domain-containing radical SAM protein n=1 Tax=Candidatus Electronema sp. TaxID=2698783 RepID=UPI0040566424
MKVLLIQQDMGRRIIKHPLYPIGLSYIAAALKAHEVRIFDPNVYDWPDCLNKLREETRHFQPDIAGISIRNIDTTQRRDLFVQFKTVRPTLDAVRDVLPNIPIMAGGTGFSIFAKEIMERLPEITYGVYLEGEETAQELLEHLDAPEQVKGLYYRKGGEVLFSGPRPLPDFAALPMPRRDPAVIDITKYHGPLHNIIGVQGKRGCAFKCSYCSYLFLNERRLRLRPAAAVVDEVEHLVKTYGIKGFTFVDSVFNAPESHARDICNELIRRKIQVEWGAWLTPKGLSKELLLLLREAGCRHIGFSPDAVSDKGLNALSKGFTMQDVRNSLKLAAEVKGMAVGYNFFCTYPEMTFADAMKTLVMLFRIPLLMPGRGGVGLGWIRLEPHNELYETAIQEGIISRSTNMLPADEQELAGLFYLPKSQQHITLLFDAVLFTVDKVLKPSVKFVFHLAGRLLGRRSFYDS